MNSSLQKNHTLGICLRLRQLGESLLRDQRDIYKLYNLNFDPACFPVFHLVCSNPKGMTIMELANALGVSHPAVIKQARALEHNGWLHSRQVNGDLRKRLLVLSPLAVEQLPTLQAVWNDMQICLDTTLQGAQVNLLQALDELEPVLKDRSFFDRVSEYKNGRLVNEALFDTCQNEADWSYFYDVNTLGLRKLPEQTHKYFSNLLEQTQRSVKQQGGWIGLLRVNSKPAGTVALIHLGDGVYQIAWLSVEENYRKQGLGRQLMEQALLKAKEYSARRIFLESHQLFPGINALSQRMNFRAFVRPASQRLDPDMVLMERYL